MQMIIARLRSLLVAALLTCLGLAVLAETAQPVGNPVAATQLSATLPVLRNVGESTSSTTQAPYGAKIVVWAGLTQRRGRGKRLQISSTRDRSWTNIGDCRRLTMTSNTTYVTVMRPHGRRGWRVVTLQSFGNNDWMYPPPSGYKIEVNAGKDLVCSGYDGTVEEQSASAKLTFLIRK